jgi:hypothetical protein
MAFLTIEIIVSPVSALLMGRSIPVQARPRHSALNRAPQGIPLLKHSRGLTQQVEM